MVDEFARFHAVLAIGATVIALVAVVGGILAWKRSMRRHAPTRRKRLALRTVAVAALTMAAALAFVAVANLATARTPSPALASALAGGL